MKVQHELVSAALDALAGDRAGALQAYLAALHELAEREQVYEQAMVVLDMARVLGTDEPVVPCRGRRTPGRSWSGSGARPYPERLDALLAEGDGASTGDRARSQAAPRDCARDPRLAPDRPRDVEHVWRCDGMAPQRRESRSLNTVATQQLVIDKGLHRRISPPRAGFSCCAVDLMSIVCAPAPQPSCEPPPSPMPGGAVHSPWRSHRRVLAERSSLRFHVTPPRVITPGLIAAMIALTIPATIAAVAPAAAHDDRFGDLRARREYPAMRAPVADARRPAGVRARGPGGRPQATAVRSNPRRSPGPPPRPDPPPKAHAAREDRPRRSRRPSRRRRRTRSRTPPLPGARRRPGALPDREHRPRADRRPLRERRHGTNSFDCSGLVRYAYANAGVSGSLGGGHSASAMLAWGRARA